jgi:hypothetical protein
MVIKKSSLPAAQSALRGLTPRPSDDVSELAAIKNLRRQIERALKIGYSLDEVAKTLAQYDVHLSASQLESGLAKLKKEDKKKSVAKVKAPGVVPPLTEAKPAKVKKANLPVAEDSETKSVLPEPRASKRAY